MSIQIHTPLSAAVQNIPVTPGRAGEITSPGSFGDILSRKAGCTELKISRHAQLRMSDRGMELTTEQWERLQDGADQAARKGIKDSLVVVDDLAFIVNVPNRTVVTAMDPTAEDQNVFTNINGAVIA